MNESMWRSITSPASARWRAWRKRLHSNRRPEMVDEPHVLFMSYLAPGL
jgi:hypothetical protein